MKKVNVLTYCTATSYGSVLQSYSLKQTLKKLGYDSRILETELSPDPDFRVKIKGGLNPKSLVVYGLDIITHKRNYRKLSRTQKFINENMDVEYFSDYEKMKTQFSDEDIFLAGSDQIFHPVKLWPAFFLDFAPEKSRRLSYATSMGVLDIPKENEEKFGIYINNFNYLSVREKDMIPVLKKYSNKPMNVHIDPCFLTGSSEWRKLSEKYPVKRPYILVYAIYWNPQLNKQLKKLKKETGYDILVLTGSYRNIYADKWIFDADFQEFIWLIDNAQMVVSSSFHGVALSLIFNKKLSAVVNPSSPSRIDGLLETLEYNNIKIDELSKVNSIDFGKINENIAREKGKAIEYLKKQLNY